MTRENKIGLAVCGAFLCLVGVAAALKLRQPPTASAAADSPTPAVASSAASSGDKPAPDSRNSAAGPAGASTH